MKKLLCAALLLTYLNVIAQQAHNTISGYVRESVSAELLTGVNIYLPKLKTGTVTNTYGFYSITLTSTDSVEMIFSYVGYSTVSKKLKPAGNTELNIELQPSILLNEVTVSAESAEKQSQAVQMSNVRVQISQVKSLPALLGEKDILKVLQLMPGVQKGMEGSSGIYVRGGGPDQNLIILDDAIVYNASHLFGFFSLFNGDALKSVELTKGGFPARYGGRLSSVLDINMKDGNKEEWHGEGGIGLISSRMTVEGPLKKDKSSLLVSGRRTYADLVMKPIMKAAGEENTGYYFYDLNAKVNYDFGRKNKLYLSGYFGNDKFYVKQKGTDVIENAGFRWSNATATMRWNHLFNSRLFSNTSVVYSNYTFAIYDKYKVPGEGKDYYAEYHSGISDYTIKYDLDFIPDPKHTIKAGIITISHRFTPYAYVEFDALNHLDLSNSSSTAGQESGLYVEDTWQPAGNLKINGGLRLSHFIAKKSTYFFPEPRLSVAWRLSSNLAVKASYSEMNQYIHLLSNTGGSLPTDLWVPTTDRVKPQHSKQIAAGIAKDLDKPVLALSAEVYYKSMGNVIGYKEGATFMQLNDVSSSSTVSWEDNVTSGKAWAYGAEFLLQKKTGRLTGWIGYTISKTEMQLDSVNFGKKFFARYDRRHDISLVAIYELSRRITVSGTWVYGSGNAVTLPLSEYDIKPHMPRPAYNPETGNYSTTVLNYGQRNNFRMGAYHRLDAGIQFHKQKRHYERIWEISVYNVYNRKNPFYYYPENIIVNGKTTGILKQVSLFPVIPSFTYSIKF
ncbi:MAG TPA: TonB-dependent receptor [Bacteroidales bacterium]|nr:TonB-dependent receptor [Bacteroidales bacterium]